MYVRANLFIGLFKLKGVLGGRDITVSASYRLAKPPSKIEERNERLRPSSSFPPFSRKRDDWRKLRESKQVESLISARVNCTSTKYRGGEDVKDFRILLFFFPYSRHDLVKNRLTQFDGGEKIIGYSMM